MQRFSFSIHLAHFLCSVFSSYRGPLSSGVFFPSIYLPLPSVFSNKFIFSFSVFFLSVLLPSFILSPDISLYRPFSFNDFTFFSVLSFSISFHEYFHKWVYPITRPHLHYFFDILSSAFCFIPIRSLVMFLMFFYFSVFALLSVPSTVVLLRDFFTPKHILPPYYFHYISYFSVEYSSLSSIPFTIFLRRIYREIICIVYFPSSVFLLSRYLLFLKHTLLYFYIYFSIGFHFRLRLIR